MATATPVEPPSAGSNNNKPVDSAGPAKSSSPNQKGLGSTSNSSANVARMAEEAKLRAYQLPPFSDAILGAAAHIQGRNLVRWTPRDWALNTGDSISRTRSVQDGELLDQLQVAERLFHALNGGKYPKEAELLTFFNSKTQDWISKHFFSNTIDKKTGRRLPAKIQGLDIADLSNQNLLDFLREKGWDSTNVSGQSGYGGGGGVSQGSSASANAKTGKDGKPLRPGGFGSAAKDIANAVGPSLFMDAMHEALGSIASNTSHKEDKYTSPAKSTRLSSSPAKPASGSGGNTDDIYDDDDISDSTPVPKSLEIEVQAEEPTKTQKYEGVYKQDIEERKEKKAKRQAEIAEENRANEESMPQGTKYEQLTAQAKIKAQQNLAKKQKEDQRKQRKKANKLEIKLEKTSQPGGPPQDESKNNQAGQSVETGIQSPAFAPEPGIPITAPEIGKPSLAQGGKDIGQPPSPIIKAEADAEGSLKIIQPSTRKFARPQANFKGLQSSGAQAVNNIDSISGVPTTEPEVGKIEIGSATEEIRKKKSGGSTSKPSNARKGALSSAEDEEIVEENTEAKAENTDTENTKKQVADEEKPKDEALPQDAGDVGDEAPADLEQDTGQEIPAENEPAPDEDASEESASQAGDEGYKTPEQEDLEKNQTEPEKKSPKSPDEQEKSEQDTAPESGDNSNLAKPVEDIKPASPDASGKPDMAQMAKMLASKGGIIGKFLSKGLDKVGEVIGTLLWIIWGLLAINPLSFLTIFPALFPGFIFNLLLISPKTVYRLTKYILYLVGVGEALETVDKFIDKNSIKIKQWQKITIIVYDALFCIWILFLAITMLKLYCNYTSGIVGRGFNYAQSYVTGIEINKICDSLDSLGETAKTLTPPTAPIGK